MKLDVVFREQKQSFDAQFEAINNVSDGGYERGYADGYNKGKQDGYSDGYNVGFPEGRAEGLAAGIEQGYADGYAKGYEVGYAEGYATGYAKGKLEGNPPDSEALDPDEVYRTTRPKDWLPMPTPGDDEIYLLGHIPSDLDGVFTAKITHKGCTVDFGDLVDGVFVVKESLVPTSNTRFYKTLYGTDYGNETADGYKQYLVRIKGNFSVALLYPETGDVFAYGVPMIVDAIVGVTADIRFGLSGTERENCEFLRYARYVGDGSPTVGFALFRSCVRLMSVSAEKEPNYGGNVNYIFSGCNNLQAVSKNMLVDGATYTYAFQYSRQPILPYKTFRPTGVAGLFQNNSGVKKIDGRYVDTSQCTDFTYFAYSCSVRQILNLNISSATGVQGMCGNCNFFELTFAGETTPGGWTIDLTSGKMSHKALVNMIESLPVALAPATITITGNPGATALTEEEIAVANAKNWTIAI